LKVVAQADAAKHRNDNLAVADWRPTPCTEPDCPVCQENHSGALPDGITR
jgi:hypothetical protein